MGPIGCPETSVKDCQSTLRNIPEERRCHEHRGGSLKSLVMSSLRKFRANTVKQFSDWFLFRPTSKRNKKNPIIKSEALIWLTSNPNSVQSK
jgi:hypothetical protein